MKEIEQIQKLEDEIKSINNEINNENIEISKLKEQTKKYQLSYIILEIVLLIFMPAMSFILINTFKNAPKDNSGFSQLVEMVPKIIPSLLNIVIILMIPIIFIRLYVLLIRTNKDFKLNKEIHKRKTNLTSLEIQKTEKTNILNICKEKLERVKVLSNSKIKLAK